MKAEQAEAVVIGAGPAGLMAADELLAAGLRVIVVDAKPSAGRKFLMAGKTGLNLTRDEPLAEFVSNFAESADWLRPMLAEFGPDQVKDWARRHGQDVFTGSTGRVFPRSMKASPLLRHWLADLKARGLDLRTRWRWTGHDGAQLVFDTPYGQRKIMAVRTVLALGGASWSRLGSDGSWAPILARQGVEIAPFQPANIGFCVAWSKHMEPHFGAPLKAIALSTEQHHLRGEAVISAHGLEGGGIYAASRALREGSALTIDLFPDLDIDQIAARLRARPSSESFSNTARKALNLTGARLALVQEFARPLPADPMPRAVMLKSLPIPLGAPRPMDEAISTAGGITRAALDENLMLRAIPGIFVAGEMLDWEAPTGGYLLTACLATGRWAGRAAARWSMPEGDGGHDQALGDEKSSG